MKFLFDECYTKQGTEVLQRFLALYDPPQAVHYLPDLLGEQGVHDEDWTRRICDDKEWLVITFDRGRSGKIKAKGEPLHIVCPRRGITGVYLSGTLAQQNLFEKVRAVVAVLPEILSNCPRAKRGSRFKISRHSSSFTFTEWPMKVRERKRFKG